MEKLKMNDSHQSIIFFGSGPVALKSLSLLMGHFQIEAIITKPATEQEMKKVAGSITTYVASNRSDLDNLIDSQLFKSNLGILIDFGIIISQKIIDYFPLGIINSHFSLLPQWRGPDPITFAILSGQKQTGVSLMLLVERMDQGPILSQAIYDIADNLTSTQLTDDLINLSDAMIKSTIPLYLNHQAIALAQDTINLVGGMTSSTSRKLIKDDGRIDWTKSAEQIEREIRAFIDWPKSQTTLAGQKVIIKQAAIIHTQGSPGTISFDNQHLIIHCGQDSLDIKQLRPAGKSTMSASAFLAGYKKYL